jgi:hypothetical protein
MPGKKNETDEEKLQALQAIREYHKRYYEANKKQLKENNKKYYDENKDDILLKLREKKMCNGVVRPRGRPRKNANE